MLRINVEFVFVQLQGRMHQISVQDPYRCIGQCDQSGLGEGSVAHRLPSTKY